MNNIEFRAARQQLGLSQKALAGVLQTSLRTVVAWEAKRKIPGPVALAMRLLVRENQQAGQILWGWARTRPDVGIRISHADGTVEYIDPNDTSHDVEVKPPSPEDDGV